MEFIERILDIRPPTGQSAFLWGPRKTGHEVDFIIGSAEVAIEVIGTDRVNHAL